MTTFCFFTHEFCDIYQNIYSLEHLGAVACIFFEPLIELNNHLVTLIHFFYKFASQVPLNCRLLQNLRKDNKQDKRLAGKPLPAVSLNLSRIYFLTFGLLSKDWLFYFCEYYVACLSKLYVRRDMHIENIYRYNIFRFQRIII